MIKYWVVGTSSKKYISEFIKLINIGLEVGDKINMNFCDSQRPTIDHNGNEVMSFKSQIVLRQRFDVWEGMGLIRKTISGYKIMFDQANFKRIIEFTKLNLLDYIDSKKAREFRNTVLINTLIIAGEINTVDIKNLEINQTRGDFNIKKIKERVSEYEEILMKDRNFLIKAKERIKNAKF